MGFELDKQDRLRAGVLEVRQEWLLGPGRPLGLDLLKSFIRALIAPAMNLAPIGVLAEADVPCPDVHLSGALVEALASLQRGKHPPPGARLNRVMPFIAAIAGKLEQTQLALHFHRIRMVSRAGTLLVPHLGEGKVVEYTLDGKAIWSVAAKSPWSAQRLKNGNTLIAGDWSGYVREVNPQGATYQPVQDISLTRPGGLHLRTNAPQNGPHPAGCLFTRGQ